MEEFFRFIQKSKRERNHVFQEPRAISNSVVPPAARASEQPEGARVAITVRVFS
jgi:hypothetical protein